MFDIWGFLAGFGLLIFSMFTIEDSLKKLVGNRLKYILDKQTNTSWKALWTGTWVTGLVQSSGLVTLILLAFVGAGAMMLKNAIGVVIGANIGTTMTSVIVAVLGFGDFKISAFAFPIVAAGGILLIFARSNTAKYIAKFLLGFGLIFIGLDFIKGSMSELSTMFDITKDVSLWTMGLIGVAFAGVTRSSSSVGVLTLTALSTGLISFPASIAIIMGANIGTSVPGVIASFGGKVVKRHLALAQVLFNVLSAVIGIIFFWQYIWLVNDVMGFADNPVMGNAVLNVVFNASTAILFCLVLPQFTKLVVSLIPAKSEDVVSLHIDTINTTSTEGALTMPRLLALESDIPVLLRRVNEYVTYLFGYSSEELLSADFSPGQDMKLLNWDKEKHKMMYFETKQLIDHMRDYLLPLKAKCSTDEELALADRLEGILFASLRTIKSFKNIYRDVQSLKGEQHNILVEIYKRYNIHLSVVLRNCALVIEESYPVSADELLAELEERVETFHKTMVDELLQINAKEFHDLDLDLPTMLNYNHYQYKGSLSFSHVLKLWTNQPMTAGTMHTVEW